MIDDISEACWGAMRPYFFRRALLGKKRCTLLVCRALLEFSEPIVTKVSPQSEAFKKYRSTVAIRIGAACQRAEANAPYDSVVRAVVIPWAAGFVVSWVIRAVQTRNISLAAIRKHYGWD